MRRFLSVLVIFLLLPCFSFAETRSYSVADVTFSNDDGSSRQAILKSAFEKSGDFSKHPGSLKRYLNNGKDAVYVLLNDQIIGNIPAEALPVVTKLLDKVTNVYVTVSRFKNDNGKYIYYASVSLSTNSSVNTKAVQNRSSSQSENSFDTFLLFLILFYISVIGLWIFIKISPWQHKIFSALVVITLWSFVRSAVFDIIGLELTGFIPITLSYLFFYVIGKLHYNHLIDKPVREYETKELKPRSSKVAKENAKRVLSIASGLIDKFEGDSIKPSCKEDLLQSIENQLTLSYAELETWQDCDTDYLKIAHTMLFHHSFDLLSSGKYHMYTNTLSPFMCGENMYRVCVRALASGVEKHYLSEEEQKEQIKLLNRNISSVV